MAKKSRIVVSMEFSNSSAIEELQNITDAATYVASMELSSSSAIEELRNITDAAAFVVSMEVSSSSAIEELPNITDAATFDCHRLNQGQQQSHLHPDSGQRNTNAL